MVENPRVLLVDDEEEFTSALSERLKLRGFDVAAASNGEEALKIVKSQFPQVMILDLRMPGISGIETLKQVKRLVPDLPVLLLTGYGSAQDGIKGMKLGATDYIMKPFDIDELIKKMKEAVSILDE